MFDECEWMAHFMSNGVRKMGHSVLNHQWGRIMGLLVSYRCMQNVDPCQIFLVEKVNSSFHSGSVCGAGLHDIVVRVYHVNLEQQEVRSSQGRRGTQDRLEISLGSWDASCPTLQVDQTVHL